MDWRQIVQVALAFPETREDTSYGEPSLKVRSALLTRHRLKDGSVVLLDVPPEERTVLIKQSPDVFFCEKHYEPHDIVLARLDQLQPTQARTFIERRWRAIAKKKTVAAFDRDRTVE